MEMKLDIPEYKATDGLSNYWSPGFAISVGDLNDQITIKANKAGLISLAVQLLTLAQDDAPVGCHYHYDDYSCLEDGSRGLRKYNQAISKSTPLCYCAQGATPFPRLPCAHVFIFIQ